MQAQTRRRETASEAAPRRPPRSPHTRRVRRRETLAKGLIWAAAGLTMTILLLIVGYVVVNGFYTRRVQDDEFTDLVEDEFTVTAEPGARAAILTNRSLRLRELTYDQLQDLYSGNTSFWGYITGQNRRVSLYLGGDSGFYSRLEHYLFPGKGELYPSVIHKADVEQLSRELADNPGSIAVVPAEWVSQAQGVRRVGLRQLSVVAHKDILRLQAGRRLNHLTASDPDQIRLLMTGEVAAWSVVGGPSIEIDPADPAKGYAGVYEPLAVVPVVFSSASTIQHELQRKLLPDFQPPRKAVSVSSAQELSVVLSQTPGSVGLLRRREVQMFHLSAIEVRRVTHNLNLRPSFIIRAPSRAGAVGGVSYIIVNTLAMVAFVLLIATPLGVSAAVYLVEYAKQGRLLRVLRIGTDTLAGVPSIIFGLFGLVFFAQFLGLKTGLLSGTLTLTLMILPTLVRTSEEALRSVPRSQREGSLALGATKLQTIIHVVLPAAAPGILTGVILGIGRAVGETAALLFTMGSNLALIRSINSPIRVLSVHLYMLVRENISIPNAFSTATILIIIVFLVNYGTTRVIGGRGSRAGGRAQ